MINPVFDANLKALQLRPEEPFRRLAEALSARGPEAGTSVVSRAGQPLASLLQGARKVALVSTFDAQSEAHRWSEGLVSGSSLVVWGGAGPLAWNAALEKGASVVFAVEPRLDVWQSLFSWHELAALIASRQWYALWGTPEACVGWMAGRYHPLWDGGLNTRDWRVSTADDAIWEPFRRAFHQAVLSWTGDFSTQAHFGARWYRNLWINLKQFRSGPPPLEFNATSGAIVTGAGPGLEAALEHRESRALLDGRPGNGWVVLATDTSLPALLARGVRPDVVLCLDGQQPSAQHFHGPLPPGLPVLADLASIPLLHRLGLSVHPFLSGHPLGPVIERWYTGFPHLDGSTGNVSGLGLAVARELGAREIRLWGADFSYPLGKTYARGTYVYPLNHRRSGRLEPAETLLGRSCYGASGLETLVASSGSWGGQEMRYTTPRLREYRTRMFSDSSSQPGRLVLPGGSGWPDVEPSRVAARPARRWSPVTGDFDALREDWRQRLESLPRPHPGESVPNLISRLSADHREDWLALWPLGLALQRLEGTGDGFIDRLVAFALQALQD